MEDWAEIRRLYLSEHMSIKTIARRLGLARNTVRNAVRSVQPPKYRRAPKGSIVDAVEPQIRALLQEFPTMPATVVAQRVGWAHGKTVLADRVRQLRPVYLPPDPASRTSYLPGEIAQCDFWFPDIRLPVGCGQVRTAKQLPVLTMVCGYSRWLCALLIPTRSAEDLFTGWWAHLSVLGAVPRVLVWDGESAVGRWRAGRSELTNECQAFRGTLGTKVIICRPADPEAKGLVERVHDYLERSFLPGRSFTGPADFNTQLAGFVRHANLRIHRVLGCAPTERISADRAAMLALPPVAPTVGWRTSLRLPRDYYVRIDANDYSVHPSVIGRTIEVVADLERVRAFCEGTPVAEHQRLWAKHQTVTDPTHLQAARALRRQRLGVVPAGEPEVAQRRLTDYDQALGITDGQVA